MRLFLQNTPVGLVPLYDSDYDEKKKLKQGQIYEATIRVPRNIGMHRKFFALINAGYSYLPEKTQNGFRSVDGFRQYVTVAAGFYDTFYSPKLKQFVEIPKSISFSSMDEAEFASCFNAVKEVIFSLIGKYVSEEEFMANLSNF